jgi:hypothetical protein
MGATIIETTVSFNLLSKAIDVSAKELNRILSLNSNVDSSCAVDGMLLGLHKVVCVSSKTKSSSNKRGSVRVNLLKLLMNTGGHNSVLN